MTKKFWTGALALFLGGSMLVSTGGVSSSPTTLSPTRTLSVAAGEIQLAEKKQKQKQPQQQQQQPKQQQQQQQQMQPQQQQRMQQNQPFRIHKRVPAPAARTRHYRNVVVRRPYGHWYRGYGHHRHDDDAFRWLAFTAITLALLNHLSESQQRAHEAAQIQATTAPVGQPIVWNQGGASGDVMTTRDGTDMAGNYCREFQQTVTIGGQTEQAYGTACQGPDGAWQMVQ
jgi:hypothetical protein